MSIGDVDPAKKAASQSRKTRGSDGGIGKTRRYPQTIRTAAELLYKVSALTQLEICAALDLPKNTLQRWLGSVDLPSHRRGVQGALPEDTIKAQADRIRELEAQNSDYQKRLAKMQRDPLATDELIADLRQTLALRAKEASVGEAASALSTMMKIKVEETKAEREAEQGKTSIETPGWSREHVAKMAASPTTRPIPTDHDRGIIPDESLDDADGASIGPHDDDASGPAANDSGVPGGAEEDDPDAGPDGEDEDEDRADDDEDEL
jgi:hypothetical protein